MGERGCDRTVRERFAVPPMVRKAHPRAARRGVDSGALFLERASGDLLKRSKRDFPNDASPSVCGLDGSARPAVNAPSGSIVREIAPDGNVVVRDGKCRYVFRRLRPGAIEVEIVGTDRGQFGTAAIDEVALALMRERSLELFVDASQGSIVSIGASGAWTRFLEVNREGLKRVTILASSRPMALTMAIVRHLSNTGDLMQICPGREAYEARKFPIALS